MLSIVFLVLTVASYESVFSSTFLKEPHTKGF